MTTDDTYKNTYRASEVVALLQKLIAEHGDLPVVAKDADTGWRLEIGITHKPAKPVAEYPERIEIRTDYHSRPEGAKSSL